MSFVLFDVFYHCNVDIIKRIIVFLIFLRFKGLEQCTDITKEITINFD